MSAITDTLDQLETRLQLLIEGRMARLVPIRESRGDLAHHLVSAMRVGIQEQDDGSFLAPNIFILLAHPSLAKTILNNQPLRQDFADLIREAGVNAGLRFANPPVVNVSPNSEIDPNNITIIARIGLEPLDETVAMPTTRGEKNANNIPLNAFLIVNGGKIFVLDQSVINIGRRSSNDLAIDDPRISRTHAQLRAVRGQYVISDLDSTGGTSVNNQRIAQCVLHPRDVIALAGVPLVYGQDAPSSVGETQKYVPPPLLFEKTKDNSL